MKTLQIHVTQGDIDDGIPANCAMCPIARAVHRASLPEDCGITVTRGEVVIHRVGVVPEQYILPNPAICFVRNFDDGSRRHLCAPSTFELIQL